MAEINDVEKAKPKRTANYSDAALTIIDAAGMPAAKRAQIATWLRDQAKFLTKSGVHFSKFYRARFNSPN